MSGLAPGQIEWDENEIANVFDGIDLSAALARVEAKGVTPYDFGFLLLRRGHPDKAKEWFVAVGIQTKDLQYVYGLAWSKLATGDNQGAAADAKYILARKPSPKIKARTLFLLGTINVDEHNFKEAHDYLNAGLKAYEELNLPGGQYLCTTMLAMCAVFERNLESVPDLLEKGHEYNEKTKQMGYKPASMGRTHEIISELRFAETDYHGALLAAREGVEVYRRDKRHHLADELEAKIGLLLLLTGEPKSAHILSVQLWETHHESRDRGRLLAYNSITLMKFSLCAGQLEDAAEKERAARAWANAGPGGKELIRLLEWVKDQPYPEWR